MLARSTPGVDEPGDSDRHQRSDSPPTDFMKPRPNFEDTSLKEFLELDDRPTFVLEKQISLGWTLVYTNSALREDQPLSTAVKSDLSSDDKHSPLGEEVENEVRDESWHGCLWKKLMVRERWLVFQRTGYSTTTGGHALLRPTSTTILERPPVPTDARFLSQETVVGDDGDEDINREKTSLGDTPVIDWTRPSVAAPTPYVQFFKSFDWASTPLGPIDSWPPQLRTVCNTVLADDEPGLILWGPALSMLYNQACVDLIGQKHPAALGTHPKHVFGELWYSISALISNAKRTGKLSKQQNMYLPLNRRGWLEETYWTFTILPLLGPDGTAVGIYDRFVESTVKRVVERRMSMLVKVGDLGSYDDLKAFWKNLLDTLSLNTLDTPFAAVYSVANADEVEQSSEASTSASTMALKTCHLEAHVGIIPEQNILPSSFSLSEHASELSTYLVEAWRSDKPVYLRTHDGSLPCYLQLQNPDRCFGDVCQSAVILPIRFTLEHMLVGFVIKGINSRRPLDEDYKTYLNLLHRRIVDAGASTFLPVSLYRSRMGITDDPQAEEHRTKALQREESLRLASTLLLRTHEAELKQNRFMRLAERAPIGMGLYDSDSKPIFFNDAYFDMTGQNRGEFSAFTWLDHIHDDDIDYVVNEWKKLADERIPVTLQHRVKKPWRAIDKADGSEIVGETWILSSAFPEPTGDGPDALPALIMGWTIDISHQKWAEKIQRQRLEDALENKRQSENFIDITSHEMRNPLSAILQSADGISTLIATHTATQLTSDMRGLLQLIQDNAQTIILCAQHQKRIVDDILTLSKLDSNLLLVTPDKVDPIALANHVLKMYEAELATHHISYSLHIEEGYNTLQPGIVLVDPSRLLQVLINLLTNAIKFTQLRSERRITLSINASLSKPTEGLGGAAFVPVNSSRRNPPAAPALHARGEPVYVTFSVRDSGRGLSENERKLLFLRFSQTSPRTHVQYGGSGLGLFISRELTEIQGGQIGVASEPEKGSTFSFYVKTWRSVESNTTGARATLDGAVAIPFTSRSIAGSSTRSSRGTKHLKGANGINVLVVEDNIINQKGTYALGMC